MNQIDGRQFHWNEPHEGTKYAIIIYESSRRTKSSIILEKKKYPKSIIN